MFITFKAELLNRITNEEVIIEDPDYQQLLDLGYSEDRAKEIASYVVEYYQQMYFYELIWRNRALLETDFYFFPDVKTDDLKDKEILDYRKQLRDYPRQTTIPYRRPVRPLWLKPTGTFN